MASGKIWYFDSNVLNSYEKMRQHIHGSFVRIGYGKVFPNETNYFNDNPKLDKWEHMRNTCGIDVKSYTKTGRKIYICCNRGDWWLFRSRCKRRDWA